MSNTTTQAQPVDTTTPLAPEELVELNRKVGKAKTLLILHHPFFGATVLRRPFVLTYSIPTASMSANGTISLNPRFGFGLTTQKLVFLLAHEAMHYMLMHSFRRGHRDPGAWNIAADKVINDTLIDAGVGEFIDGGMTMRDARNYSAEELYDDSDKGDSPGGAGMDVGSAVNDDGSPMDDAQLGAAEADARVETLQAAQAAKMAGKLPASMERIIEEMAETATPWHEILERYMMGREKDGQTWTRPNRRFLGSGIYLPGTDFVPKMGEIVVGVDTSCSIADAELAYFQGHLNRILETCRPEAVHVVYCDAEVAGVEEFTPDDYPIQFRPKGGGGTAFKPVFDWTDANAPDAELVVYLTDGYGDQRSFKSDRDTVWVTTGSTDFDWGVVLEFDMSQ